MNQEIKQQDDHIRFLITGNNDLNELLGLKGELKSAFSPFTVYPQMVVANKTEWVDN